VKKPHVKQSKKKQDDAEPTPLAIIHPFDPVSYAAAELDIRERIDTAISGVATVKPMLLRKSDRVPFVAGALWALVELKIDIQKGAHRAVAVGFSRNPGPEVATSKRTRKRARR